MHFDDRLETVLRMRADGTGLRRIQFRQLLDLLGTSPAEARGDQIDLAYLCLAEIGGEIPPEERIAMLRDPALRLRSPRLVAVLSATEPQVAQVTLQRARLNPEQWLDLIPALPPGARPALRQRGDLPVEVKVLLVRLGINDRGLPMSDSAVAASANDDDEDADDKAGAITEPERNEGIGAIVRRIEAYRRAKTVVDLRAPGDSPRLPLGEDHILSVPDTVRAADFASDAQLRIVWCDAGVAPMLVGMRLNRTPVIDRVLRQRQPLSAQRLELTGAPAISGQWQIDAAPWFGPLTGQFRGYRGRLRRPATVTAPTSANPPVTDSAADRIRQMLHELRTPVNAIQGFAEVIQQQLFGPTPHEYRALAAGIAGDAARILSAFEELERLARLESGAMEMAAGDTDLVQLTAATVAQLGAHTASRSSGFAVRIDDEPLPVPLDRLELERIVWRLLATLAGTSAPGEQLKLRLRARDGMARLDLALPATLAAMPGDALFEAAVGAVPQVISSGVFGIGFALRLARAEARAAGGDLVRKGDRLRLTLPGLTATLPGHTHTDDGDSVGIA